MKQSGCYVRWSSHSSQSFSCSDGRWRPHTRRRPVWGRRADRSQRVQTPDRLPGQVLPSRPMGLSEVCRLCLKLFSVSGLWSSLSQLSTRTLLSSLPDLLEESWGTSTPWRCLKVGNTHTFTQVQSRGTSTLLQSFLLIPLYTFTPLHFPELSKSHFCEDCFWAPHRQWKLMFGDTLDLFSLVMSLFSP